jgi:hypothetical protein
MTTRHRFLIPLLLAWWGAAQAGVIYDNSAGTPDIASGSGSELFAAADNFVLQPAANTITDIHWTGVYAQNNTPPATDSFTIQIYPDAGGEPNAPLYTDPLFTVFTGDPGRTDTLIDILGSFDLYAYSVNIAPLTLTAGSTYWLSIVNDTAAGDNWFWGTISGAGNFLSRINPQDNWTLNGGSLDFQLTDDLRRVPEPGSIALLAIGALGLIACTRPRRKRVM